MSYCILKYLQLSKQHSPTIYVQIQVQMFINANAQQCLYKSNNTHTYSNKEKHTALNITNVHIKKQTYCLIWPRLTQEVRAMLKIIIREEIN